MTIEFKEILLKLELMRDEAIEKLELMPAELVLTPRVLVLAEVEMVWMPRELVLMPFLAEVETVWMPAELVLMPFFADVETD